MRVSKPDRPGMAARKAESIDSLCFSKDAPCEQARNLSPALRWQALCRRLKNAVADGHGRHGIREPKLEGPVSATFPEVRDPRRGPTN